MQSQEAVELPIRSRTKNIDNRGTLLFICVVNKSQYKMFGLCKIDVK